MNDDDLTETFAVFYREHRKLLWGYLYSELNTPKELIDDIVQDSFLAIRTHWPRIRDESPKAYLFKAAERLAIKRMAKFNASVEHKTGTPESQVRTPVIDLVDGLIARENLQAAVRKLADRQRQAIELRYFRGLSVAETAQVMGVTEGTIKSCTHDGIQNLRELLSDETDTGEVENR